MGIIVDTNGKPITDEIASIRRDPYNPLFSGLINVNDDTLATRGGGKGIRLYEEIERDAQVFSCLNKRKMAVISRPWEVLPASDSRIDKKAAEAVRVQLEALNFDALCLGLLDAINKGFAVGEIIWESESAGIVAKNIIPRDQRRFLFGENYELRLKTRENLLPGEEMPPRKFIVHSMGAKDGNPHGHGLGSKLFWPVWFKRQGISFWMTFLDKFGSPTTVGKYPTGTQLAEQQALMDAMAAISNDSGIKIPEGMTIELLEATRGGQAGYESMCRYMDEQIAYCVLGEAEGGKQSGGAVASAAITRNEVRLELVQFDADMLSATLNDTLVKWISEFNVPGATPPTVWRKVVAQEDIKLRAERDQILFNMGMRPDDTYQAENYPGWTLQKAPAGTAAATAGAGGAGVAFAEGDGLLQDPDPVYTQLDKTKFDINPAQAALDKALQPVIDALMKTKNAGDGLDMLSDLFPQMDDSALQGLLERAFFVADIMGQMNANA